MHAVCQTDAIQHVLSLMFFCTFTRKHKPYFDILQCCETIQKIK